MYALSTSAHSTRHTEYPVYCVVVYAYHMIHTPRTAAMFGVTEITTHYRMYHAQAAMFGVAIIAPQQLGLTAHHIIIYMNRYSSVVVRRQWALTTYRMYHIPTAAVLLVRPR